MTNLMKSMRRPRAEREGTHGPRLENASRNRADGAIVAVARKLAGILHRMWIDGSGFKVGFGAKVTQRLKLKPA